MQTFHRITCFSSVYLIEQVIQAAKHVDAVQQFILCSYRQVIDGIRTPKITHLLTTFVVVVQKGMAILSYFGILVLIPIFAAKNDPFARYHANQGLVLFILLTVCSVLSNVLTNILYEISPMLVLVVSGVFGLLTFVFCIFALIGIIRAAKGQMKPLPLIGGIKILK